MDAQDYVHDVVDKNERESMEQMEGIFPLHPWNTWLTRMSPFSEENVFAGHRYRIVYNLNHDNIEFFLPKLDQPIVCHIERLIENKRFES